MLLAIKSGIIGIARIGVITLGLVEVTRKTSSSFNKRNQTRYVYEMVTYLNEETQEKITKRHIIGKIDPATGTMVNTGPRGRPRINQQQPIAPEKLSEDAAYYKSMLDAMEKKAQNDKDHSANIQTRLIQTITTASERLKTAEDELHSTRAELAELVRAYRTE